MPPVPLACLSRPHIFNLKEIQEQIFLKIWRAKGRSTYEYLLNLADDPDVIQLLKFLREREIVHFQRFGEALRYVQEYLENKRGSPITRQEVSINNTKRRPLVFLPGGFRFGLSTWISYIQIVNE